MAAAANATTTRIGTHLGRRELMLGFMESLLGACLGNSGFCWREEGESDSRLA